MLWRCEEQKGGRIVSTYCMLAGVARPDVDTMKDQVFAWGWEGKDGGGGGAGGCCLPLGLTGKASQRKGSFP